MSECHPKPPPDGCVERGWLMRGTICSAWLAAAPPHPAPMPPEGMLCRGLPAPSAGERRPASQPGIWKPNKHLTLCVCVLVGPRACRCERQEEHASRFIRKLLVTFRATSKNVYFFYKNFIDHLTCKEDWS